MLYAAYTDNELKDELAACKSQLQSVIIKWTAGDTSVEKEKLGIERRLAWVMGEIRRRPSLAGLLKRTVHTRSVGRIVE